MERHGAIGRFRMCAGLMLPRHALKVGHVVIGGKKNAAPGAKKRGRKAKSAQGQRSRLSRNRLKPFARPITQ